MNHSPEFVAEMKNLLLKEKKQLSKELGLVAHEEKGDFEANFPDYGRSEEENANEVADYQAMAGVTEMAQDRLKAVDAALERIEAGTYGITADKQFIPEARLRANPAADTLAS